MALGLSACLAAQSESVSASAAAIEMSASSVNVPTGAFFDESHSNFIYVQDSWLRICIGGQKREYDFHAEKDYNGNYVLTFGPAGQKESITIYSNGRTLNYNGREYSKN